MSGIVRRVIQVSTGRIGRARIREEYEDEALQYQMQWLDDERETIDIVGTLEITKDLYERIAEIEYQIANTDGTDLLSLCRSMFVDLAKYEGMKEYIHRAYEIGEMK